MEADDVFKLYNCASYPNFYWFNQFQALLPAAGLQYSMFFALMSCFASDGQKEHCLTELRQGNFGIYLQTELRHSQKHPIETVAVYDKSEE